MGMLKELWAFAKARRKYWLLPLILVILLIGGFVVIAQASPFASFLYTIF
jgi:hypothetical protein